MLPELKDESLIAELICDFSSGSDMGVSWPRAVVRRGGGLAGGGGGAGREEEVGRVLVPLELHGRGGLAAGVLAAVLPLPAAAAVRRGLRVLAPLALEGGGGAVVGRVLAEDAVDGVGGGGELVLGVLGVAQQRLQVLVLALAHALHHLVPHDAVDAGDAGHAVLGTHAVRDQPLPDLPGEHGRVLPLVLRDGVHHVRGGHLGLAAADHPGAEGPGFVIS